MRYGNRSILWLTGAALLAMPGVGFAQDAAPQEDSGDIIVTAQRQEQKLQDVPVSVTAFSSDQLRASNIETLADIATRTPGLSASAVDPINTNFAMRGIGSPPGISQNAGGDPSGGGFGDGVYGRRGATPRAPIDAPAGWPAGGAGRCRFKTMSSTPGLDQP